MSVKIEETKPDKPFVEGDLVQDIRNLQYIYLLGHKDNTGRFAYTCFTKHSKGARSHVSMSRFNFNDGNHQLYKGRIILEND